MAVVAISRPYKFCMRCATRSALIALPEGGTWLHYDEALAHYKPIVDHARTEFGRDPYADFSVSYKKDWIDTEMSDHLPVWIEIETDYSDKYLLVLSPGQNRSYLPQA